MSFLQKLFWKHKHQKHVISPVCYDKLPPANKQLYEPTEESPTHKVSVRPSDDEDADLIDISPLPDLSSPGWENDLPPQDTPSTEFGGGDGGGGGASGDWSSSDDSSSSDSSSSDSGSSDSGSSDN